VENIKGKWNFLIALISSAVTIMGMIVAAKLKQIWGE
jgi:hypothetical protein